MLTQTLAIFLDAYRELNARKLFWITLILSGLVVALFGLVGITETGIRFVIWEFEGLGLNTDVMSAEEFYKSMFVNLGIGFWLAWIATILALVSTASIFPDFVSGGSIDLALSKPIGRLRLFLTKYISGLLFVTLQVTVFSLASFLLIGIMGGAWEPALFLAVPVIVVFFSYLFCICVLLGIITRSTIASLMLTLLIWFLIFIVHAAESSVLTFKVMNEQRSEWQVHRMDQYEERLERIRMEDEPDEAVVQRFESDLLSVREEMESTERTLNGLRVTHNVMMGVKTVLPKTSETVDLLRRWLIDMAELPDEEEEQAPQDPFATGPNAALEREIEEHMRERSITWIVGTSLLFEFVVLALGAWIFVRRDF